MKGNRTNHKIKYARDEDLKELKEKVFHFIDNDFRHLQIKAARQDAILYILLTLTAVLLARTLGAF